MNFFDWIYGIYGYLWVSASLFCLGILSILSRKNAIGILLGVELLLNSAAINFIAFNKFGIGNVDGHIFTLFIIIIAAAESAVGLAIILRLFALKNDIDPDKVRIMRN